MARPPSRKASRKAQAKAKAPATRKAAAKSAAKKAAPAPRRPPEISAAKWKTLSAGYKKRLAGFYRKHPGAPLYRARGKQAGESLSRRERLNARIEAYADRQAYRGRDHGARDASEIAASIRRLIRDHGEGAFGALERATTSAHRLYVDAGQPSGGMGGQIPDYYDFEWDWGDYDGEDSELFYH